jgi:hypothetical protein
MSWMVRGSNPGGAEIFRTCPDRPWGPPSLLYNGYQVFPRGKEQPGCDAEPSPPSSGAMVKKGYSYTSTLPMGHTAHTEPQCLYKGALYLYLMCTYSPPHHILKHPQSRALIQGKRLSFTHTYTHTQRGKIMILHILMFLLPLLLDDSKEVGLKVNMVKTKNFIAFHENEGQNYKTHNLPTVINCSTM